MSPRVDLAEVKKELALIWARIGPFNACEMLGLQFRREGKAAWLCCPWHGEKSASCIVKIGPEGTLRCHCFACNKTWDIHSLMSQVRGLSLSRSGFARVLSAEAELLGRYDLVDSLDGRGDVRAPVPPPAPMTDTIDPEPERDYPDRREVLDLYGSSLMPVHEDEQGAAWLRSRCIDPMQVHIRELAYALKPDAKLPWWARFQKRSWSEIGHRLIVPLYGPEGSLVSVRACRVIDGDTPKRLPPAGCKAKGLIMANAVGLELLRTGQWPTWVVNPAVIITEGEPDYLTAAHLTPGNPTRAVFGICSGSWCDAFAAKIPDGSLVGIWTDQDKPGNNYAKTIGRSLSTRCRVGRGGVKR